MNQTQENFLRYLDLVQTILSHLLQDGEVLEEGVKIVEGLLLTTEDLQNIYRSSR